MMRNRPVDGQKGFTLIEIVVAVAILALFVGVIYSSFFTAIRAMRATEETRGSFQPARVILQRIQRDLKGAVHVLNDPQYVFNGIDGYGDYPELDRIDFVTCSHIITGSNTAQSDLAEVSYYIDKSDPDKGYLVRREDVYLDDEPDKGGELKIIAENIVALNFKYFLKKKETDEEVLSDKEKQKEKEDIWEFVADPENWQDEWDWEETPFLPIMVKVELTLREEKAKETTFSTVVYLNRDPATVQAARAATTTSEGAERDFTTQNVRDVRERRRSGEDRSR